MFIFIPQLGYMLAVEKNKKYFKFINKISNQFIKNQENIEEKENEMEQTSHLDQESLENITIDMMTTSRISGKNINFTNQKEIEKSFNSNNSNDKKSYIYSDFEQEDEDEEIKKKGEELKEDEDEDEENFLNNYDETLLLQNICFKNIDLKFQFHNETFIYYKNGITKILDETYGDLSARITDLENAIFREISKQILNHEKTLLIFNEFISYLDCFLNLYLISEKFNLSRPILNQDENDNTLELIEARNLILEYCHLGSYVKNDFSVNGKNISIISGINSSGKSCFLRLVFFL